MQHSNSCSNSFLASPTQKLVHGRSSAPQRLPSPAPSAPSPGSSHAGLLSVPRRPWCAKTESASSEEDASVADKTTTELSFREPPKYHRCNSPDYMKWKDEEEQIVRDIEPIIMFTKEILHSDRYADGESLTVEDERAVVEKLLSYHPHSEDKIGGGLDSIMVDRHPQFRSSRCLFVVRTDGGWIDFSYRKCLRAYI